MNVLIEQLAADPWGRLVLHFLATSGMRHCFLFLLVAARLCGILIVAPLMGTTSIVPLPARAGLAVLLSLIIVPTLPVDLSFDANIRPTKFVTAFGEPRADSTTDLLCLIGSELGLGTLLGIGVFAVLSGFKLGAEWIDRSSGLGLGTVLNPDWSAGDSANLRMVSLLGVGCFLFVEPLGGSWLGTLVESFQAIPVGSGSVTATTIGLLNRLVQQSLILGIRIAIPLVLMMLIIEIAIAFAGRNTPVAFGSVMMVAKAGIALFLMALTLTAIPEAIATSIIAIFA